jgi:hypothetical protein
MRWNGPTLPEATHASNRSDPFPLTLRGRADAVIE